MSELGQYQLAIGYWDWWAEQPLEYINVVLQLTPGVIVWLPTRIVEKLQKKGLAFEVIDTKGDLEFIRVLRKSHDQVTLNVVIS